MGIRPLWRGLAVGSPPDSRSSQRPRSEGNSQSPSSKRARSPGDPLPGGRPVGGVARAGRPPLRGLPTERRRRLGDPAA
eukprot:4243794-Alexandrium_andersonii.AAC.1